MHPQCLKCNARCCRYFCFQISTPETYEDFEQVRWYLTHENISVLIDPDGDWWILIDNRCKWLAESAEGPRCIHYDDRPVICRRFSPETCDFTLGPYQTQERFTDPDLFEAYARRTLGEEAFARARFKEREPRHRKYTKGRKKE